MSGTSKSQAVPFLSAFDDNYLTPEAAEAWLMKVVTIDPAAPVDVLLAIARDRLDRQHELVQSAVQMTGITDAPELRVMCGGADLMVTEAMQLLKAASARLQRDLSGEVVPAAAVSTQRGAA